MNDLSKQIRIIARDLIHLEVNTIVKPSITGQKMPRPRHAFIDIAQLYLKELTRLELSPDLTDLQPGSYESFGRIREKAQEGIRFLEEQFPEPRKMPRADQNVFSMLERIQGMSDQIEGIFNGAKKRKVKEWDNNVSRTEIEFRDLPMPLAVSELVVLRKIWELGTEEIAFQTVVQLDGDVITRVQPGYVDEDENRSRTIQEIHNRNLAVSMRLWSQLSHLIQDFFKGLARALKM